MSNVYVELIMWETIKRDCKYPDDDNNNNYIYGLNFLEIFPMCTSSGQRWAPKFTKIREGSIQANLLKRALSNF